MKYRLVIIFFLYSSLLTAQTKTINMGIPGIFHKNALESWQAYQLEDTIIKAIENTKNLKRQSITNEYLHENFKNFTLNGQTFSLTQNDLYLKYSHHLKGFPIIKSKLDAEQNFPDYFLFFVIKEYQETDKGEDPKSQTAIGQFSQSKNRKKNFRLELRCIVFKNLEDSIILLKSFDLGFVQSSDNDKWAFSNIMTRMSKRLTAYLQQIDDFKKSGKINRSGNMAVGIDIGYRQGVKISDEFNVYENQKKKGVIKVFKVEPESSQCFVIESQKKIIQNYSVKQRPRIGLDFQLGGGIVIADIKYQKEAVGYADFRLLIDLGLMWIRPLLEIDLYFLNYYLSFAPISYNFGLAAEFFAWRFHFLIIISLGGLIAANAENDIFTDTFTFNVQLNTAVSINTYIKIFIEGGYKIYNQGSFYTSSLIDLSGFQLSTGICLKL